MAHHWFGDLVTMAWWDDTWLNESFGSWVDAPVTEALDPGWRHLAEAQADRRAAALQADAQRSVKRIREPVASAHDIEGSFDNAITYDKGASVLAMIEAFVGRERFRAAVTRHLQARAHAAATAEDLYAAFGAELGPEVAAALRAFVEQPGAPLVRVEARCQGAPAAHVTQARFLADGGAGPGRWRLPLCLKLGAQGRPDATVCGWADGAEVELPLPFCPEWLWPNAGGTGYWLSALPAEGLADLSGRLTAQEQLALATDARLLARRGDLPVDGTLALGLRLAASEDRLVLRAGRRLLGLVDRGGLSPDDRARLRQLHLTVFGPRARAAGWLPSPGESDEQQALRRELVEAAAGNGEDPALEAEARRLAERWLADRRAVPADVAPVALGVAARRGDAALFDALLDGAARARDGHDRTTLLRGLGAFRAPALVRRAQALLVPAPGAAPAFDLRDTLPILHQQLAEPETQALAWGFLTTHWKALSSRLRGDEGQWLVVSAARLACDASQRRAVAGFLTPRAARFDGAPRALAVALEEADACAAARRRNGPAVSAFLAREAGGK
ncbi:MAG: ERAP1-like C-terminal domain-containing protein [Anaeromyxobacter sp.]